MTPTDTPDADSYYGEDDLNNEELDLSFLDDEQESKK